MNTAVNIHKRSRAASHRGVRQVFRAVRTTPPQPVIQSTSNAVQTVTVAQYAGCNALQQAPQRISRPWLFAPGDHALSMLDQVQRRTERLLPTAFFSGRYPATGLCHRNELTAQGPLKDFTLSVSLQPCPSNNSIGFRNRVAPARKKRSSDAPHNHKAMREKLLAAPVPESI
jgi:hypothetical protein